MPTTNYFRQRAQKLVNSSQRESDLTKRLTQRTQQPITQQPGYQAGRGELMTLLRRIQQQQQGRSAALGIQGGESEIGQATGRAYAAAEGVRGLTRDAAQGVRSDTALLLSSMGLDAQEEQFRLQLAEQRRQRRQQLLGALGGSLVSLLPIPGV